MELLNYKDVDATDNINKFSPQNSATNVLFGIYLTEFMVEEFKSVVAEEYKTEN